jgi:hypothetical protein
VLGNLSAAQYEGGDYKNCVENAEKALAILSGIETSDGAKVEKLERRILKAKVHCDQSTEDEQTDTRLRLINSVPGMGIRRGVLGCHRISLITWLSRTFIASCIGPIL